MEYTTTTQATFLPKKQHVSPPSPVHVYDEPLTPPAVVPVSQSIADEEVLPTLDSLSKSKPSQPNASQNTTAVDPLTPSPSLSPPATPLSETEEEAEQQEAYNEETGEINWDCPCLGGMAHGPCGEQFRAAFSCFVYSKEEPKGLDCIDHFK